MPEIKTLDQKRAAYAWAHVSSDGRSGEYVTLLKGAPALVMSNGLMQALAYYQAKSEDGKKLVAAVGGWLKQQCPFVGGTDFTSVMNSLYGSSALDYMHATVETLEILKWMKQAGSALTRR